MWERHFYRCQLPTSPSILPLPLTSLCLCDVFHSVRCNRVPYVRTEGLKHSLGPMSHPRPNIHSLSSLFHSFPLFFPPPILSQLEGRLMLSTCCRERTEHLSSLGGGGCRAPCFALPSNTRSSRLDGRQPTGDQTLAPVPVAGFHSSLLSPADLGHFHVGQKRAPTCFVSVFFFSFYAGI